MDRHARRGARRAHHGRGDRGAALAERGGRGRRGRLVLPARARCFACAARTSACPVRRAGGCSSTRRSTAGRTCSPPCRRSTASPGCSCCPGCSGWSPGCSAPSSSRCAAAGPVLVASLPLLPPLALLGAGHPARPDPARLAVAAGDGVRRAGPGLARPALRPRRRAHAQRPGQAGPAGRGRPHCSRLAGLLAMPVGTWAPGDDAEPGGAAHLRRPAVRRRAVPLPARVVPEVRRAAGRREAPAEPLRHDAVLDRGRARRQPGAARRPGPLRRRGLGRQQRRPARGHRRHLPAGLRRHRQPRRGAGRSTPGSPSGPARAGSGCPRSARCRPCTSTPPTGDGSPSRSATTWPPPPASCRPDCEPGDVYTFTAVSPPDALTPETVPSGNVGEAADAAGFLDTQAVQWSEGESQPMRRVFAVAAAPEVRGQVLRRRRGGREDLPRRPQPLPAHRRHRRGERARSWSATTSSTPRGWRCSPTGSACPPGSCSARSSPTAASSRVPTCTPGSRCRSRDGSWRTLPTDLFMDQDKPAEQQAAQQQPISGTVVPPPAPIPPPSTAGEQNDADMQVRKHKATATQTADEDAAGAGGSVGGPGREVRRRPAPRDHVVLVARSCWPSCCAGAAAGPGRRSPPGSSAAGASWSTTPATSARQVPIGQRRDPARAVAGMVVSPGARRWPVAADGHVFGPRRATSARRGGLLARHRPRARGDVGLGEPVPAVPGRAEPDHLPRPA